MRKRMLYWFIMGIFVGIAAGLGIALYLEMQVLMIDVIQYPAHTVWA